MLKKGILTIVAVFVAISIAGFAIAQQYSSPGYSPGITSRTITGNLDCDYLDYDDIQVVEHEGQQQIEYRNVHTGKVSYASEVHFKIVSPGQCQLVVVYKY